jgi:hypothetical protein
VKMTTFDGVSKQLGGSFNGDLLTTKSIHIEPFSSLIGLWGKTDTDDRIVALGGLRDQCEDDVIEAKIWSALIANGNPFPTKKVRTATKESKLNPV